MRDHLDLTFLGCFRRVSTSWKKRFFSPKPIFKFRPFCRTTCFTRTRTFLTTNSVGSCDWDKSLPVPTALLQYVATALNVRVKCDAYDGARVSLLLSSSEVDVPLLFVFKWCFYGTTTKRRVRANAFLVVTTPKNTNKTILFYAQFLFGFRSVLNDSFNFFRYNDFVRRGRQKRRGTLDREKQLVRAIFRKSSTELSSVATRRVLHRRRRRARVKKRSPRSRVVHPRSRCRPERNEIKIRVGIVVFRPQWQVFLLYDLTRRVNVNAHTSFL